MRSKKIVNGGAISAEEIAELIAANGLTGHTFTCTKCGEPWGKWCQEADREAAEQSLDGDYRCMECVEAEMAQEILSRQLTYVLREKDPEVVGAVVVDDGVVYVDKGRMILRYVLSLRNQKTIKRLGSLPEGTMVQLISPPEGTPWITGDEIEQRFLRAHGEDYFERQRRVSGGQG